MNDDLDQLLTSLKMRRTREVLPRVLERAIREKPAYDAFLVELLREEYTYKRQKSLEYRIEHARIPELFTIETFPFDQQPSVSAPAIKLLAGLDFISAGFNLVFIGNAGVGKTGLATGILYKALVNGHRGRFIRAQDLFDEINASLLERSSRRVLNELCGYTLLCIDELGPQARADQHLLQAHGGEVRREEANDHHDQPRLRAVVRLPGAEGDGPGPARPRPPSVPHDPHRRHHAQEPHRLNRSPERAPTCSRR